VPVELASTGRYSTPGWVTKSPAVADVNDMPAIVTHVESPSLRASNVTTPLLNVPVTVSVPLAEPVALPAGDHAAPLPFAANVCVIFAILIVPVGLNLEANVVQNVPQFIVG
jgi:hypothetical protein